MKHAVTRIEFHERVARQLNRLMSGCYYFKGYNGLIVEWKHSLDISCTVHIYKGVLVCTQVGFVHYTGKRKPIVHSFEDMGGEYYPECVAINIARRVKEIISKISKKDG